MEDADLEVVLDLALAAWKPVFESLEAELGPDVYGMLFPDWRSAQARAVEAVFRAAESNLWVALEDGRPVGFVALRYVDEDAARAGEIQMMAVHPDRQRGGLGTSLVQRALDEMEGAGVKLAVVATGGDRGHAPARALYEGVGFRPLPTVRYYRKL